MKRMSIARFSAPIFNPSQMQRYTRLTCRRLYSSLAARYKPGTASLMQKNSSYEPTLCYVNNSTNSCKPNNKLCTHAIILLTGAPPLDAWNLEANLMRTRKYSTPSSLPPIRPPAQPWVGSSDRNFWAMLSPQSQKMTSMPNRSPYRIMSTFEHVTSRSYSSVVTPATLWSRNHPVVPSKLLHHLSILIPSLLCSHIVTLSSLRVRISPCSNHHKPPIGPLLFFDPLSCLVHLMLIST